MSYTSTIFDLDGNPMSNYPVDLLQNKTKISETTTDANGVATFSVTLSNTKGLSIRSKLTK